MRRPKSTTAILAVTMLSAVEGRINAQNPATKTRSSQYSTALSSSALTTKDEGIQWIPLAMGSLSAVILALLVVVIVMLCRGKNNSNKKVAVETTQQETKAVDETPKAKEMQTQTPPPPDIFEEDSDGDVCLNLFSTTKETSRRTPTPPDISTTQVTSDPFEEDDGDNACKGPLNVCTATADCMEDVL